MSLHIHHTDRLQTASLYYSTPCLSGPASLIFQTISPLLVVSPSDAMRDYVQHPRLLSLPVQANYFRGEGKAGW